MQRGRVYIWKQESSQYFFLHKTERGIEELKGGKEVQGHVCSGRFSPIWDVRFGGSRGVDFLVGGHVRGGSVRGHGLPGTWRQITECNGVHTHTLTVLGAVLTYGGQRHVRIELWAQGEPLALPAGHLPGQNSEFGVHPVSRGNSSRDGPTKSTRRPGTTHKAVATFRAQQ